MKHVFITGANGFIGREVTALLQTGAFPCRVTCLKPRADADLRDSSRHLNDTEAYYNALAQNSVQIVEGDIRTCPVFGVELLQPIDTVIHLAADTLKDDPWERLHAVNCAGTNNLIETLGSRLRGVRVILGSTLDAVDRSTWPANAMCEDDRRVPSTSYGRSKAVAEDMLLNRADAFAYQPVILRFASVYGENNHTGFVYELWRRVKLGRLSGRFAWPGRCSIAYVHDVASTICRVALADDAPGRVYHVGAEPARTVAELLTAFARHYGHATRLVPVPRLAGRLAWWPPLRRLMPYELRAVLSDYLWTESTQLQSRFTTTWTDINEQLPSLVRAYESGAGQ